MSIEAALTAFTALEACDSLLPTAGVAEQEQGERERALSVLGRALQAVYREVGTAEGRASVGSDPSCVHVLARVASAHGAKVVRVCSAVVATAQQRRKQRRSSSSSSSSTDPKDPEASGAPGASGAKEDLADVEEEARQLWVLYRTLRNLCAVQKCQDEFKYHAAGVYAVLLAVAQAGVAQTDMDAVVESRDEEDAGEDASLSFSAARNLLRSGGQLLCNFTAGNEVNQRLLWADCQQEGKPGTRPGAGLLRALLHHEDDQVAALSCSMLYNCLANSPRRLDEFSRGTGALTLAAMLTRHVAVGQDDSPLYQWVYFCVTRLLLHDGALISKLPLLRQRPAPGAEIQLLLEMVEYYTDPEHKNAGGPEPVAQPDAEYVPERIRSLPAMPAAVETNVAALTAWLVAYARRELVHVQGLQWQRGEQQQAAGDEDDLERELEELEVGVAATAPVSERKQSEPKAEEVVADAQLATAVPEAAQEDRGNQGAVDPLLLPACVLVLRIVGNATATTQWKPSVPFLMGLSELCIVPLCLNLLVYCTVHLGDMVSDPNTGVETQSGVTKLDNAASGSTQGLKAEVVRTLGNLAFLHPSFQTEVGSLGGVELVMNQCRLDDKNPFLREWAVFALRNLLQGHAANQKIVEDLKVQAVANPDELSAAGIDANVDPLTGKVRVRNTADAAVRQAASAARQEATTQREQQQQAMVQEVSDDDDDEFM